MDRLSLRDAIRKVFDEWRAWPGPEAKFSVVAVEDTESDQYVLLTQGWDGYKRIHGLLAHLEIHDDKIWIQEDNTEEGLATDLLRHDVPRLQIVLAFQHPSRRQYGEFAVA